ALEIEGVEKVGSDFENFVVGEILEISKHPNADKLQLTKVNVGNKTLDIVCGAKNISVGDKVPVALVGAKLPASTVGGPNGLEIKEAEIRGEKSFGMLCAKDELGLGSDHNGILLLNKKTKVGTPLKEVLGENDYVLEIKVLPDRAHDAVSHVGLAREVAALDESRIEYDYDGLKLPKKKISNLKVLIENKNLCSRYVAAKLDNVKIEKSPDWISSRLEKCGIRAINNVVDVTNYVMLEIGQPMHAFDFAEISNGEMVEIKIRDAKKDEEITLLDGSVKKMSQEDIVIANGQGVLALAGVMGGKNSGVSEKTVSIVFESATFNATAIRKTKNKFALQTDAAMRFEKGLDPNLAEKAMVRAIEILTHITDAKLDGLVDEYPLPVKPWTIKLDLAYVNLLLGENVPAAVSKKILSSLGFEAKGGGKILDVIVPTFRLDVQSQEDLIEEIGRVYGYEKIRPIAQLVSVKPPVANEKRTFVRNLKNILVGQGFSEVYNYAFYSQQDSQAAKLQNFKHLELEAPGNLEQTILRVSLIPNLLKNVGENLKFAKELQLFEIGKIFLPSENVLPNEKNMLCGMVVLEKKPSKKNEQNNIQKTVFFEAKTLVNDLMVQLGITDQAYVELEEGVEQVSQAFCHEGRSAEIKIAGKKEAIGVIGEVNPLVLADFDINSRVAFFEFDLELLRNISDSQREYKAIPKYPNVMRDVAMIVAGGERVDEILSVIQEVGGNLVVDVDLFDIFDFADGTSSYAFHIMLNGGDRTLISREVDVLMQKISESLEANLKVKIRK
ncbi:MAG: phenylalanine--tRNA ligase subunit beta, partial [Candidatus Moranbacteria bacterium]|nr:phenylalanine--tRNA ligase subunit beta [Candidatus Moranbacteria bacterium]